MIFRSQNDTQNIINILFVFHTIYRCVTNGLDLLSQATKFNLDALTDGNIVSDPFLCQ